VRQQALLHNLRCCAFVRTLGQKEEIAETLIVTKDKSAAVSAVFRYAWNFRVLR
jgi:hypothetical protein